MDLKYILCEPVSKLAAKANEQAAILQHQKHFGLEWSTSRLYSSSLANQQHDWNHPSVSMTLHDSPKSVFSSLSTCSSTSSNNSHGNEEFVTIPDRSKSLCSLSTTSTQQPTRRRTASDVSLTRHHMFVYSHFNRRPRSESASSSNTNNNVQTRTPWTPFEDHLLQQGYDQGLSWAMISSTYLPHRSRGCCWGRFKTLQNKNMIDPNHTQLRHFRRPWKSIDFSSNIKKSGL